MKVTNTQTWFWRCAAVGLTSIALAACGGGGGDSGSNSGGGNNGGGDTGGGSGQVGKLALEILGSTGQSVSSLSASETGSIRVKLSEFTGGNERVQIEFSEETPSSASANLLNFSPSTALTNAEGVAEVDVSAVAGVVPGVATIVATATNSSGTTSVAAKQFVEIKQDTSKDPQTLVAAINSVSANPADKSIVISGSGGAGRSETAQLTFQVVDAVGAPVRGATVEFSISASGLVGEQAPKLLSTEAVSNANGQVVASIVSGTAPTSAVVRVQLKGRNVVSQSDTVTVTTGVADSGHIDLSASRHVVDLGTSGDSSDITIKIADVNGNPVADSVAVVTTTNFGRVGTSDRGGCTLQNGNCTVQYQVQNPRPNDGDIINVVASARVGSGAEITDVFPLRGSHVAWVDAWNQQFGGSLVSSISPSTYPGSAASCEYSAFLFFGTPAGTSAPTGSSITVSALPADLSASIQSGASVQNHSWRSGVRFTVTGKKGTAGVNGVGGEAPINSGTLFFKVTSNNGHESEVAVSVSDIPGCEASAS